MLKKFFLSAIASVALMSTPANAGNANMYQCTLTQNNGVLLDYVFVRNTDSTFTETISARNGRIMPRRAHMWRVSMNGETSNLTYMHDARFYIVLPTEVDVNRYSIAEMRVVMYNSSYEIASGHCVGSYKEGLQPPID